MNIQFVLFSMCVLGLILVDETLAKRDKGRRQKKKEQNEGCSEWVFGDCVPKQGQCGKGKKQGTRTGENCQMTTKEFRCSVPCAEGEEERRQKKKERNEGCSEWVFGNCVPKQGQCGKGKKQGTRTGENCQMKTKEFRCSVPCAEGEEGCHYKRGDWSECDTGTYLKTMTMTLKEDSSADCQPTQVKTKKCRVIGEDGKKAKKGCKFDKGDWSECDEATNVRTRVDTLKKSAPGSTCEESRTLTRPCK